MHQVSLDEVLRLSIVEVFPLGQEISVLVCFDTDEETLFSDCDLTEFFEKLLDQKPKLFCVNLVFFGRGEVCKR